MARCGAEHEGKRCIQPPSFKHLMHTDGTTSWPDEQVLAEVNRPKPRDLLQQYAGVSTRRNGKAAMAADIERAYAASGDWKATALAAFEALARERAEFTTDDVWEIVEARHQAAEIDAGRHGIGGVTKRACSLGYVESTGTTVQTQRERSRRHGVTVWRSLLLPG